MGNWFAEIYGGKNSQELTTKDYLSIEDFPDDAYGFVYIVTHRESGKSYIGKKNLYNIGKKRIGVRELAKADNKRKKIKIVKKESNWKTYCGSSKAILDLIEKGGIEDFDREILKVTNSKRLLTYYECKYIFDYDALELPDSYFNDNILGKFYSKDFINQ